MGKEKSKRESAFRSESIVAFVALLISLVSLAVYIYQAQLMREQQHISVWPYLEWDMTISSVDGIRITVVNKGVGPAIIKNATLKLDDEEMDVLTLLNKVVGNLDSLSLFYGDVNSSKVLAPGEQYHLFDLKLLNGKLGAESGHEVYTRVKEMYPRIKYEICYCSVYGDCWTSQGLKIIDGPCK
jgi:hypothetical protein